MTKPSLRNSSVTSSVSAKSREQICLRPSRYTMSRAGYVERVTQGIEDGLGHFVEVRWFFEGRLLHVRGVGEVVAADAAFLQHPQHVGTAYPSGSPGVVTVGELQRDRLARRSGFG